MQGRKNLLPKMMYQVSLDDLVGKDNFYRELDKALDMNFLYPATHKYYSTQGQDSIDPVVFFKICLVAYINNINSDRKLMEYCSNCLDIRLYLKYDIDEALPWHSTISRTRQLYGEEVFLKLFQHILKLCMERGMVRGKRQCVDSAFIKANASMDSLLEKEVLEDVSAFVDELNDNSEFKVTTTRKKLVEQHHKWKQKEYKDMPGHTQSTRLDEDGEEIRPKFLSNHTHYSPTDPDAKISVKPGKARQLNYCGQLAVDDAHHVITGACASTAGSKDSAILHEILEQTRENFEDNHLIIDQIIADAGYSSGEALKYLNNQNIDAYIPNFGQYKPEREGFYYNKIKDQYECHQKGGNKAILPMKRQHTDSKGYEKKTYRSSETVCKNCPLKEKCIGGKTHFKKIDDSIHKPLYDAMHEKLNRDKNYTRKLIKRRSSTVEPVLGTLINHHNMKRLNARGMAAANKHVLMAALSYNLKKYMRFTSKKSHSNITALEKLNLQKGKSPVLFYLTLTKATSSILSHLIFAFKKPQLKTTLA